MNRRPPYIQPGYFAGTGLIAWFHFSCICYRQRLNTDRLREFIYSPLSREQNCCRKDALDEFTANAFVQSVDALFLDNCKKSIQRRLVLQSIGMARLLSTFHHT